MRKHQLNEAGLVEVEIDGNRYEFEQWGAEESLDVLLDISGIVGGPIGAALSKAFAPSGDGMDTELDSSMLGVVFEDLSKNLKKDVVKPIFKKLCAEKLLCNGKKVNFNTHYKNNLFHMFKVAKIGLEVQFGNFFEDVQGVAGFRRPPAVTIPENPI